MQSDHKSHFQVDELFFLSRYLIRVETFSLIASNGFEMTPRTGYMDNLYYQDRSKIKNNEHNMHDI